MPLVHHTKNKGDLAVAKAHADLVAQGFVVLFPATEHAPFDLVTYDEDGTFQRVQVKYRSARTGALTVNFRSVWADSQGTHMSPTDKSSLDLVCIYCPETDHCYYIRPTDHGRSVTLRIVEARNGQVQRVIAADRLRAARALVEDPGAPLDGKVIFDGAPGRPPDLR